MSRMILCESSAGWSTVVFSNFSVIDERSGVSCGSKNTSHVESHVGKSAFVVAFSVAFFLLIGLLLVGAFRFTGDLFFQWNTEGTAVGFKVLLRPVSEGR